jgi:hypothetical protein
VFERENPGFDAIVGNPPFLGGKRISITFGDEYRDWLAALHEGANSNADLVTHFFRRAFFLLREGGAFGLIATNTIAQGDTRSAGLRWICTHGGAIFDATKRRVWPGAAAVVVSVVHVFKGALSGPIRLDGRKVDEVTAFLFYTGGHDDPARLPQNAGRSFQGSTVLGMGFTFDDTNKDGVASPLSEYRRLWENEHNRTRLFPYLGGEEVNDSPTHAHHRYAINFGEISEVEARRWPELMTILEAKVKPERAKKAREVADWPWWQYWRVREELYAAVRGLPRVLVVARVGQHGSFTFLPTGMVYSDQLVVFAFPTYATFCALQCRVHEVWARFLASSMKDDLRYTPSDCFETFPFPDGFDADPRLEAAGERYYTFRAELMVRRDEGLTRMYNRFHDPTEKAGDIVELRRLHAALDRAVLDAYGWSDVPPACDFFPEHADEEEAKDEGGRSRRRRYRYRWPDEVRDAVLARLLELNRQRAPR